MFIFYYFSFSSCPSCHANRKHSTENNATKVMKTQKKTEVTKMKWKQQIWWLRFPLNIHTWPFKLDIFYLNFLTYIFFPTYFLNNSLRYKVSTTPQWIRIVSKVECFHPHFLELLMKNIIKGLSVEEMLLYMVSTLNIEQIWIFWSNNWAWDFCFGFCKEDYWVPHCKTLAQLIPSAERCILPVFFPVDLLLP